MLDQLRHFSTPFALVALASLGHADVSGIVRDSSTMAVIPDALVTLQATSNQTATLPDGSFDLPLAAGSALRIVAAKKGYYNGSILTSSPSVGNTILLDPVVVGSNPNYSFLTPSTCSLCHPDQYAEWTGSPMAKAGGNTWVYDIFDGSGTPGGMGGFVYTRDSVHASHSPESECASCHQPEPWIQTPFSALEPDINNLSQGAAHGISCEVCHKIANVDETKTNFPGIWPGAVEFTRPTDPFTQQVEYGVLADVDYEATGVMRASYQPQLVAEVCAVCHQDKNDHDEDGDFEDAGGIISEPTYSEWIGTPYADPQSPHFATCVDCHMPPTGNTVLCTAPAFPPPQRDPNTIRSHRIEGTTPYYLENAVDLSVDCVRDATGADVVVTVANNTTGHHVPTGVTVRNMILLVEAVRLSDGALLTHLGTQVVDDLGGVGNPAQGYYSGLAGKMYAKRNHDANMNGPTFFTDATGLTYDTRIPALGSDMTTYRFDVPPGTGEVEIRTRLIYRRAFRFLVDAKGWTTDGHGNPLEDVQAPYFGHLMEEVIRGCDSQVFVSNCNGDGGDQMGCTNCPCGNNATAGTIGGCLNSASTSARLVASGDASVSLPVGSTTDLRFGLTGVPANAFTILNSGDALAPASPSNPCFSLQSGVPAVQFDGLRCAIANTRRHGGRSADANGEVGTSVSPWGGEGNPAVGLATAFGGFSAGQTRYFQAINRDDPLLSCMRGLNTTQAIGVTFTP